MFIYKSLVVKRIVLFTTALSMLGIYTLSGTKVTATGGLQSLQQQYQQLQNSISQNEKVIQQNNNAISGLSAQIQNYQNLILQKEDLITNEQTQINDLNSEIQKETIQINSLKAKINVNSKSNYEQTYVSPITMFANDPNVNSALESVAYFNATMNHEKVLVTKLNETMASLQQNKSTAESLYASLVSQKQTLVQNQNTLQSEEASFSAQNGNLKNVVSQSQAQEQQILNEINALTISEYQGGNYQGCIKGNSWYYCQQWYGRLPGKYGTSINMTYGCLVTSIAMVATKELSPMYTPPMIASMSSFSNDYMTSFPQFPNASINSVGSGIGAVNQALSEGLPAIVYLSAPYGQHWIVIYRQLPNGDYLINDPWYGSRLTFLGTGGGTHEYYSFGEIGTVLVIN